MKKIYVLPLILAFSVILSGCSLGKKAATLPQAAGKKQVINAIPINERPFLAIVPHSTNRLLTLYFDKPGKGQNISLDIEYLAGNSLKGGRTAVKDTTNLPYTTAFLLGSCSTGGKCSFDTDITTGTLKTSMEIGDELHILKSNFVFIGKSESTTTDQKTSFLPSGKLSGNLILSQTHGYIGTLDKDAAAEPVAITSSSDKKITGTLSIYAPDATSLVYYDGTSYKPLTATKKDDRFIATLNLSPWSKTIEIIRDDQKGAPESTTLYLLGPIVPIK